MRKLLLIACLFVCASAVQAAQSLTLNGTSQYTVRTITNASPFTSVGSWRVEMRLTNIGSGTTMRIVDNDHFYIQFNGTTGALTVFSWDSEITDTALTVNGFTGHLTDITIRVQKDMANSRYTVEAWDSSSSTRFATGSGAATTANRNYANDNFYIGARSIEQAGSAGQYFDGRIAFFRWYSTLVSYEAGTKPILYSNSAGLLQMEYESNLNDSSGNSQTFTDVGTVTYNTTPTINPIANAGVDVGGRIAGVTFALDCSGSVAGDVGPITTYAWTRTVGSGTISSPSSASTNITGISAGQSTFQCEASDGTLSSTDTVDVGVVAVNADGTVNISDAGIALLIGPQVPYGSAGSQVMPYYDVNAEEGYIPKRKTPSVAPRVDPAGTLAVTNGSAAVVGTSTLFTKHVAQQAPGGNDIPLTINGVSYIVSSVTDDTHLTLTTNYAGSTTSGITDWGQDAGAEASDLFTSYWHYYDAAYNAYISYYRTGLTKWLTEARRLADARWTAANIDYGARAVEDSNAPREIALGGLIVRALDGKPEYFDFCYRYTIYHYDSVWVTPRLNYRGLYFGVRDGGYATLFKTWMSQVLPNTYTLYGNGTLAASTGTATDGATKRADMLTSVLNGVMNYYIRLQRPDGSWRWGQDEQNFLASGINSSDTTITLTDASTFRSTATCATQVCDLKIDNEYITYTTRSGNTITGVTRGRYGTTAASHSTSVLVTDLSLGFIEQTFHVGVGLGHAMRDLLRILQGNGTYATEYNAIRASIMLNAAEGMLAGYDTGAVTDTPSISARRIAYALHSWGDWGPTHDGMPDTVPVWPTIVDLRDARQNIVTWAHMQAAAYHYSGVPWFKTQLEEVLSANWGKTGYTGTIGTSDGYYALQDYFSASEGRRQKEHNEWHRTIGSAFAWHYDAPEVPTNLAPWVSIDGGDRVLANGTSNPSFTARGVDPEGTSMTYSWSNAMGCSATLSGASTATVTVTSALADNTDCGLKVVVTDAAGNAMPQWVMYRTRATSAEAEERPPIASVPSQSVSLAEGVTSSATALDLSGSTVFGGRSLKYRWVQVDGTDAATISNHKAANPTVTSLANGQTYVFFGYIWDNRTRSMEETGTDGIFLRIAVGGEPPSDPARLRLRGTRLRGKVRT
jgi:hypothetical protein